MSFFDRITCFCKKAYIKITLRLNRFDGMLCTRNYYPAAKNHLHATVIETHSFIKANKCSRKFPWDPLKLAEYFLHLYSTKHFFITKFEKFSDLLKKLFEIFHTPWNLVVKFATRTYTDTPNKIFTQQVISLVFGKQKMMKCHIGEGGVKIATHRRVIYFLHGPREIILSLILSFFYFWDLFNLNILCLKCKYGEKILYPKLSL